MWLWLGSDNNKGQATAWTQGIRAIGSCKAKTSLGAGRYKVTLTNLFLLPRTIEKAELLQASPETYARSLSEAAIVGLNNYSSQVVQLLTAEEFAAIGAVIGRLLPEIRERLFQVVTGAEAVDIIPRSASGGEAHPEPKQENGGESGPFASELSDDDPVYRSVVQAIVDDAMGGALLIGVPGTGKSWYARQIAKKLTNGDHHRIREVQFHPSYQYEDFVEGYVPDPKEGFRLADKHLLEMVEVARTTGKPTVLIVDEFSRTDPARVLGETMTYMEGSLRGVEFYLPSGRKAEIPANLYFLATMNPDDRSVDEIDDAMDRRWAKIGLEPSIEKVAEFLAANGAPNEVRGAAVEFFAALQSHLNVGHAFFRSVSNRESLARLWETQIQFMARKKFRFDAEGLQEVRDLWEVCLASSAAAEESADVAEEPPGEPEAA
ncbi:hypothetical protein AMEJIAPC_00415 [Caulobacter sp. NIBR1757]|nr:hypothetical protein AMEJIAPC_00415 [Caulobacter sp. NIBR1757]